MITPVHERIGYFGKIPARSDFVKLARDLPLTCVLDEWLAEVMQHLSADARWKLHYDAMPPVHFAFVSRRRRHAIAGHIVSSCDQSGRRFPFLMMRTLEVADPAAFVSQCPLALHPLWMRMAALARAAVAADDPAPSLHAIAEADVALDAGSASALAAFLATGTMASLNGLLGQGDARHLMLALGMLLQPVLQTGSQELEKSLALPLPRDEDARCHVAAFWMALIAPFLRRADVELALFIASIDGNPMLVLGFRGACSQTLQAIIDPALRAEQQIGFADTGWVDEQLGVDIDVRALASYLEQPQLPLRLARELFLQTFTGAAS